MKSFAIKVIALSFLVVMVVSKYAFAFRWLD